MTLRSSLFAFWRVRADVRAVRRGRVPQRLVRRFVYTRAFRAAGWLTRLLGASR